MSPQNFNTTRGVLCSFLMNYLKIPIAIIFLLIQNLSFAQSEIPLGTWRAHISFNNIHSMATSDGKIYGASQNGVVMIDRSDNSISTLSKINGLHGTTITAMNYFNDGDKVLIAYLDGKIDVLTGNDVRTIDITGSVTTPGSKRINYVAIRGGLAYAATDYGVVILDLATNDVKETWRDIGAGGETAKIFKTTFSGDSIFLATDKGVFAGDLRTNLLDYNFWRRFDTGKFSGSIQSIEAFNGRIYATVKDIGLYRYEAGQWTMEAFLEAQPLQFLNASSNNLLISSGDMLWRLSANNVLTPIVSEMLSRSNMAIEETDGTLWIADSQNGIVSEYSGASVNYLPNGPSNASVHKLAYRAKVMYAVGPLLSEPVPPRVPGKMDAFSHGTWSSQSSSMSDLTDIAFNDDQIFLSSFGYGVEQRDTQTSLMIFDETNSPLSNVNPPQRFVNITAVENGADGIWVSNYGALQPLHMISNDKTWTSHSFTQTATQYPLDLITDIYNNVWMILDPEEGGGVLVYNKEKNTSAYLADTNGLGGLPSRAVRSGVMDLDGMMWLGTDEGVCFVDPVSVFSSQVDAIKPIFENSFLLRNDKVTALAVDGGNRKWIGTERGVWLFTPSGEILIYNFTSENSPLPSNLILDIEINDETGEVFFSTDKGLVSFRSDATAGDHQTQHIKIFPNPVTSEFNGTVGISGLSTDAIVKITDVAGKTIWETKANGSTASWNLKDTRGRRASTGVYLVFSASPDGVESVVGKIAVVE
jgi:ligand-binding sensor domain-containing protein